MEWPGLAGLLGDVGGVAAPPFRLEPLVYPLTDLTVEEIVEDSGFSAPERAFDVFGTKDATLEMVVKPGGCADVPADGGAMYGAVGKDDVGGIFEMVGLEEAAGGLMVGDG